MRTVFSLFFVFLQVQSMLATEKQIALTFDDGPGIHTNAILDILQEHNIQATFFVLGTSVARYPEVLMRTAELGHEIGNHSWNHENLRDLSPEQIRTTMQRTSDLVEQTIGRPPTTMRPPFGLICARGRNVMEELGYPIIMWSLDPRDWQFRDEYRIYKHIVENVREGDIILLHDIHKTTYQAVAMLIPTLIEMGFSFVTVEQLLGEEIEAGQIYRYGGRS